VRGPQLGTPCGGKPVTSGRSNRKEKIRHGNETRKTATLVERCFGRLKDHCPIAILSDMFAGTDFSAIHLVRY
jgi:hypothetical protein